MQGGASRTDGRWHVYVIHEVDMPEICKIGIAGNVMARLGNLQTGTWRRLKIAAVFLVGDQQFATAVERQTHSALAGVHELGEWFKVRPERAVREIEAVC